MEAQNNNPEQDEEERSCREQDLFYKRRGLAVSVAGFALVILGLIINILQSEKVAKSIRVNVENSIVTHVTSLDQVFIADPGLTPYFYANAPINKDDPKYPKVSATAVMTLDVFDEVAGQNRHYPEFWDTPEAWDEWVIGVFSTSPILRDTFDKYPCWYGKRLWELRRGQIKSGGNATTTRPCVNPEEVSWTWPLAVLWFLGGLLSAFLPPGRYRLPLVWMPYLSPGGVRPQAKARSFLVPGIIGAIGGLVGGWLFFRTWIAGERVSWPEAAATLVGSYVLVQVLVIIYWVIETWWAKHHARVMPEGDRG